MNLNEQQFVRTLMRNLRESGWDAQRIEDKYSTGIPDINACKRGEEVWLEAKVFRWPARKTSLTRMAIRDDQLQWARRRTKAGGQVFLVAKELRTKQVYLFSWSNFDKAEINPFVLTKDELIAKASGIGTTSTITDNITGEK